MTKIMEANYIIILFSEINEELARKQISTLRV